MSELRFIDLFCGIGGFRMAFERAGCRCVFSCDRDKFARKTYAANFGEEPAGDITQPAPPDTARVREADGIPGQLRDSGFRHASLQAVRQFGCGSRR